MSRPQVTLCYTQTLDGRTALPDGRSQWIGAPESLRFAHELRARHDAIMVGIGTVLADNPRLTVRHVAGSDPIRIIVDSKLRIPVSANVLIDGAASGTLIATTAQAERNKILDLEMLGAQIIILPESNGQVELSMLVQQLPAFDIHTLMVEGGARLITSLLRQKLADRMAVCIAPRLMGDGLAAIGNLGIRELDDMPVLEDIEIRCYGRDIVLEGRLCYTSYNPAV